MGVTPPRSGSGPSVNHDDHEALPPSSPSNGNMPGLNVNGSPTSLDVPMTDAELQAAIVQGTQSFCTRFYQSNKENMGAAMKPVVDKASDDDD